MRLPALLLALSAALSAAQAAPPRSAAITASWIGVPGPPPFHYGVYHKPPAFDLPAELEGTPIGAADFGGGIPLGRHQGRA